jgi:hypothetical protein
MKFIFILGCFCPLGSRSDCESGYGYGSRDSIESGSTTSLLTFLEGLVIRASINLSWKVFRQYRDYLFVFMPSLRKGETKNDDIHVCKKLNLNSCHVAGIPVPGRGRCHTEAAPEALRSWPRGRRQSEPCRIIKSWRNLENNALSSLH